MNGIQKIISKHNLTGLDDEATGDSIIEAPGLSQTGLPLSSGITIPLQLQWIGLEQQTVFTVGQIAGLTSASLGTTQAVVTNVGSALAVVASGVAIGFTFDNAAKTAEAYRKYASNITAQYNTIIDVERQLTTLLENR